MSTGEHLPSVDVLIVGAGPVGLFGAYYAGFRGLRVGVIDSLPVVGDQVNALYPEKIITDIAGLPAIRGRELIDNLVQQAPTARRTSWVSARSLAQEPDNSGPDQRPWLVVTTSAERRIRCKAVIIAGGIGTFTPRPLAAAKSFRGEGLDYFVQHLADYADQDVVIVTTRRQSAVHHRRAMRRRHRQVLCGRVPRGLHLRRRAQALHPPPEECIDCGACEPVCPVEAIYESGQVPAEHETFVGDNAHFFEHPLPGQAEPIGSPGGAAQLGPVGVDTPLVAQLTSRE